MNKLTLGVDTSNYTTSLALCRDGEIIKSVRRLLPVSDGKCGLRQSDAVFLHTKALPELADELFAGDEYSKEDLCAVGVSATPRDAEGSYMPCFLAGVSFATAVSLSCGVPLYRFSHQAGHIMAGLLSSGVGDYPTKPFYAFHVSGGTTEALLVTPRDGTYLCEIIGGTNDASAGQIIDRTGVLFGLPFPCGAALDKLASSSEKVLPIQSRVTGGYFSLSGLQNKCEKFHADGETDADIARFLFGSIARNLQRATENIRAERGHAPVLYVGGVMSNSIIRAVLAKQKDVLFASPALSSDNACGIAALTYTRL